MAVTVETLDKLERKITLTLPADDIKNESRVPPEAPGAHGQGRWFPSRQGALSLVAQRYGYSVQYEVMNDKVGEAFAKAAAEAQLRVAGAPAHHREGGRSRGPAGV